jgi:hypothetical protein
MKMLQSLLCNYIKLIYNKQIDIPTLNSQVGSLYDINEDDAIQADIENSSEFFDTVINEQVLNIIDGQHRPSDIYNTVTDYMHQIGEFDSKTKKYKFNEGYEEAITILIVDSTDYFLPDLDDHGSIYGRELDNRFQKYLKELVLRYKITPVVIVPPTTGMIKTVKDTEPHLRHLGSYANIANKGICIYNPLAENNVKYFDGDVDLYITKKGNILLRSWHVVRNTDGVDNSYDRMLFMPGTSYMKEYSYFDKDNHIVDISQVIDILREDTNLIKSKDN